MGLDSLLGYGVPSGSRVSRVVSTKGGRFSRAYDLRTRDSGLFQRVYSRMRTGLMLAIGFL